MEEKELTGGAAQAAEGSSDAESKGSVTRKPIATDGPERGKKQAGEAGGIFSESEGSGSGHGPNGSATDPSDLPETRRERYRALVTGEFKDLYTADTQRIIDRRFKETRELQETLDAQRVALAPLLERYGAADVAELETAVEAYVEQVRCQTQRQAEKRLADHIRSGGARPQENGASAQTAVASQKDVGRLTAAERAEFARRAARGETITFR